MSREFLPFRWRSFGRGGESSSFATSLSLSYALFAMCCYARAQREWGDHSRLIAPFTNPVETRSASQAMNLCSQLLGACGELFSSGFKHPFEVGILRFAQMSGGTSLPLSASAADHQCWQQLVLIH